MKTNNKSFSQTLREGMILYAAANTCYPMNKDMMQLLRSMTDEEMN